MKTADPATETVCGVWKGYYGTESEINSIIIKINPQNKAEIISNSTGKKTTATYKLVGDSAIVISCTLTEQSSQLILQGNLNRTSSFIDGQWDSEGKGGGSFYLQKQFIEINL